MMKKFFFITIFGFSTLLSQSVVSLDGSNDYLTTTETTGTKLDGDFTISGWVFPKGDATQQVFYNDGFEIQYRGSYYRQFKINPGGYDTNWGTASINEWHHIAVTRSGSTVYIYLNGELQRTISNFSDASNSTYDGAVYLGRDPNFGEYFRGFMDEFAIWNTALDSNTVKQLYNNGMPKSASSVSSTNLRSYWKMDDASGTKAANSVSTSPGLVLNGAGWSTFSQSAKPERLADIYSGYNGSYPRAFKEYNGKVYFVANDGNYGDEIWVYNPSDSTTTRVTDISSGSTNGVNSGATLIEYRGKLYFEGYDGTYGAELYSYDGTNVTRITDIYSGSNSSDAKYLTIFNDTLYFVATNNTYGYEWYSYDGSSVTRRTDIRSGEEPGVYPWSSGVKVYKSKIYFSGYDSNKGVELFSYDETNGAQLVKDIYDGSGSSYPGGFTLFDGNLYLTAGYKAAGSAAPDNGMEAAGSESGKPHDQKILKYDGTDLTVIDLGTSVSYFYLQGDGGVYNNKLYFQAYTSSYGSELWSYDETNGAQMVGDSIYPGSNGSYPNYLRTFDNKLYFQANDGVIDKGGSGSELWYYDGTDFGRAGDIYQSTNSSSPQYLLATNDALYFAANDGSKGSELWAIRLSDPTPTIASITSTTSNGTYKVSDVINITVNFSEAVTLSSGGTLTVTLETGTTDQTVDITSISNATSASGTYTIIAGDISSDLTVSSISVTGSLTDASSQAMSDFSIGTNLASSSALVVDGVLPTIASVKSSSDNATYSTGAKINITVNFSEAVTLSSGGTMTITLETGITTDQTVSITSISSATSASGTYTVQDGDSSDSLLVNSIVLSIGATLDDAAENAMSDFSVPADSNLNDFSKILVNTTKPGTPTNLTAENRYGGIGLKWYSEASAAKYYVYRSSDNATFAKLANDPADTTYIDSVTAGSKYYYYVTAVTSAGSEGDSSKHVYGYATKIWWVDINGSDSNSGKAETEAFKTIEQAVKTNSNLVSGDTVYVNPSITSSNSTKYSGYYDFGNISGGINLDHNKDFVLKSTAGADSTILNAEGKNRHFYFDEGQTSATQIIGFTFFNGKEEGNDQDSNWEGGGSVVISGSNTNIKFENCIFDSNRVTSDSDGGAIVIRDQAVPEFTSCTFNNNFAIDTDNQRQGGAIRIRSPYSVPDLQNTINFKQCKFIGNYVQSKYNAFGGAVYTNRNTLFENCLFVKNGAISGYGSTNTNDWNESKGGVIVSNGGYDNTGVITVISNSTFDRNYVDVRTSNGNPRATEIYYNSWSNSQQSRVYVFNTVITGSYRLRNGSNYTESESDKIFTTDNSNNRLSADYSAIEGEGGADQSWADPNVFDINPVYSDTANLDYSLSIKSPLLGQGTTSYEGYFAPTTDISGNVRPYPSGSNPDMGAYENSLSSSASPLPVTSLTATSKTNSVYLSWSAVKASLGSSTDAADIKYLVYQGDSQVGSSVSTTYTVTGLDNGTAYTFSVSAQDTSSGESGAKSKAVSITPKYRGPKWYVAASNGSAIADTSTNADLGSIGSPINHLRSAIEIASAGDTIIMQKGTHTGSNNRGIDWNASKSLVIMGDPNYTAENIIIDAGGRDRHFEFDSGEDNTYQVIGLTLYNGKSTDQGGGSVSIGNNSSPVFKKVIFKENVDKSSDWRGGGAVNIGNYSTPSFYYCTFDGNLVDRTGTDANSEAYGGAVFVYSSSANMSVLFEGCIFKNNMAKGNQSATGGALGARDAQVDIINCLFYDNTAYASVDGTNNSGAIGGAITVQAPGYYSNSEQNWVGGYVKIINSTIVNNLVKSGSGDNNSNVPGVYLDSWNRSEKVWFFNNIVWGNKTDYGTYNYQVWVSNESGWHENGINLNYNVIQNSSDILKLQDDNSFETDPTFVDTANGDYSLSNASQLIGKGSASYEGVSAPTADILGLSRPNPAGSKPDIGAYENSLSTTPYPAQVTNLTAVGGSQSVTLSWDVVAGADSVYKVYQHNSAFTVDAAYFVDTTSYKDYTISGLNNATRYYFRVSAVNTKGYEGTASSSIDITPKYSGPVWWVSTSGNDDTNEGSSGSPFGSIEHALEFVSAGDTVMLKPGTYTGSDNRNIEISSNNSSTNFDNFKNLVITSEKGAASTIIDAEYQSRHFSIRGNQQKTIDSTLQFIGLTFTGGRSSDNGGSFNIQADSYFDNSTNNNRASLMQPKFKDCIFKDNKADGGNNGSLGGAFHISDGAPIFENCVFDSNYSNNGGGAINITGNNQSHRNTLWFRDCTFKNNRADDAGLSQGGGGNTNWGVYGGAVWLGFGMDISFINCVFKNNEAVELNRNDGVYGGALSISRQWDGEVNPMVKIYNSRFTKNKVRHESTGNTWTHGGAIYAGAPFTMVNSLVDSNRAEYNANNGQGRGGGLAIDIQDQWDNSGSVFYGNSILINNTIVDNYANGSEGWNGDGGGIFIDSPSQQRGTWFNNIIWGNRTDRTDGTSWHNMNPVNSEQFKLDTDYNDLEFSEHYPYFMGSNSYDVDPAFYSATNYQLSTGSPLIGAGATSFNGSSAPLVDILGNVRPNPAGSNPDLGAYENSLAESPYPKQVKNLVGVFGSRQVGLRWDANTETDIKKYLVYMSTTMDFEPTPADSLDETTATSYTVTGLTNKTEYHFRIAAVDSSGYRGAYSDTVSVTPEYLGPNWWVSVQTGSDENGDGSIEFPFSSIHQAFYETSHADTIRIMPGTYYEHSFSNYDPQSTQPQSTGRFDLTIVGMNSTGEVIVDAQKNNRHMMINGGFTPDMQISMTFRNIHFTNGEGRDEDGFSGGGSMYLAKITAKFVNCHFSNNQATAGVGGWTPGGALNIYSSTVKIISCTFEDNFSRIRGGAINIDWYDENDEVDVEIINSTFTRNDVQINDGEQMSAWGGAIYFGGSRNLRLKIQDSIFSDNRVRNNNSGQDCAGGVIGSMSQDPNDDWSNIEPVIIDRNIFMDNGCDCGPGTWAGGSVIDVGWNIDISNSLFAQNYTQSNDGISGFIIRNGPQVAGAEMTMVNNTIVRNQLRNQNGSVNTDGSPISAFGGSEVTIFNNIIWDNESNQVFSFSGDVGINEDYNNLEDLTGQQFGANTLSEEPRFADPENGNYRLGATSPLIDKGTYSFMGHNAPIKDVRGYYRKETPDIGAYEAGASKYILTLADDIEENKDTTFVNLSQELKVTVTTGDIDGNVVTDSDEAVSWDIFPNQKYARVGTDAETTTSNGTASATIIVTSQTRGKGFRFRVNVYVGEEGFEKSHIYVIEEIVTGAPPPVVDLMISPSTWTSQPDFTLNWKTPTWAAQRDLIGAVVEITDGINVIPDYMEFPPGDTLTNYSFTAPEAGQYDVRLWLTGELGNEERDSARTVTAYFDNIQPSEFNIHWPNEGSWVSDKPQFRWEISGDYPSGIKTYHLFLNEQHYAAFDPGQVNYDNTNGEVYIAAPTSIPDGYHSWHVEIWDLADNITWSNDTINFGVDITPPNISHPSPLGTIDAGSTTPSINVTVTDGASGVKYANLHYRRSGSGGGFVTVDLMSGPVSISGSDVKEDGLEYWIDAEDNVGNYDAWPGIGEFHAVSVRSEGSISTADNWSSGIPGGTDSTNYLFFSIPFEVGNAKNAITSIMGPPDEFNYRLFSYNNGWQEDPPSVTMGNAYFFIFDPDKYEVEGLPTKIEFNFGQGTSTLTDPPYGIGVSPGQWKFFGSPYNYGVSLDNVYTEDEENIRDAGSIYTWSGSWRSAGSSLQPWKGYIFKSGGATNLNIDARGSGFGKMAKAMNTDDYPMDADEWIIDMIATTGNARDELNSVGVRHMAEDGYDRLDEFEPPAVMGDIVLRIDNRDREETPDLYAKDIRKPNETGHYWDLQVFTPTNGSRTYITFDGLGYVPEEYDIFLINKTTKQAKNLEWESSYRFANTGSESYLKQELRLVIGTKDFVKENNAGVNLYPDAFVLSQNYPNPFNPQTSIMISLEEDAQLNLIIYNLLGEEVTRLAMNEHRPAGYYTFIWNGTNAMGSKVSTGVYFYHAMIRDAQGKVVLNKTRKMIFLK